MTQTKDPKALLDAWWQFKQEKCPLCLRCMKMSSISRHIRGDFCSSLLSLAPIQRLDIHHHFNSLKSRFGGRKVKPHILSQNEKVASAICGLLGYRYQPHLEWLCEIQDGSSSWMPNNLLCLTTVGNRWIKRGQRQRKKGFLKQITDAETFEQEQNQESEPEDSQDEVEQEIEVNPEVLPEVEEPEEEEEDFSISLPVENNEEEEEEEEEKEDSREIQEESEEEDSEEEEENPLPPCPEKEWDVEKILNRKVHKGRIYYQVKWVDDDHPTWEPYRNLTGCKELLSSFHGSDKIPMSAFQFGEIMKFPQLQYLVDWVEIAKSHTQKKQRKMIICYIFTQLCQHKEVSLQELIAKQPLLSRLLCDLHLSHQLWKEYKALHENPSTLRNQCDFMRILLGFLISSESQAAILIKLNVVKAFWHEECKFWSTKANYYRRTKRTKSSLQAADHFLSADEMKKLDEVAHERLDQLMEDEGEFFEKKIDFPRYSHSRRCLHLCSVLLMGFWSCSYLA
jgi:hypothetical protein